jgi:hypothetical protein
VVTSATAALIAVCAEARTSVETCTKSKKPRSDVIKTLKSTTG